MSAKTSEKTLNTSTSATTTATPRSATRTTTFSAGATLTIATNPTTTLIHRHPRTTLIRRAEAFSKSLLAQLTAHPAPPPTRIRALQTLVLLVILPLLPFIPLPVHLLHRNALITTLAHLPAAALGLALLYFFARHPHREAVATTPESLIHLPRGIIHPPTTHPLTAIRSFTPHGNTIHADTTGPVVELHAPDKHTAEAGAQALNNALSAHPAPPEVPLHVDGELIVDATTPLCAPLPPQKLRVDKIGDLVYVATLPPRFPRLLPLFISYMLTHCAAVAVLVLVYDDLPWKFDPIEPSLIAALALAGFYALLIAITLLSFIIRCIPRKWRLVVAGYRKDVQAGMIDVGRCREVVLVRRGDTYGVRVLSTTGNAFMDVGRLTEAEACGLVRTLRECFPSLFAGGV